MTGLLRWEKLRRAAARKAVHALLACLALIPAAIAGALPVPPASVYAAALILAAWANAIRIWGPPPALKRAFDLPAVREAARPLKTLASQLWGALADLERDYERTFGWVGFLNGVIGVSATYLLTGSYVSYGVAALATVDVFSTLVGEALPSTRLPLSKGGTLLGTAAGFISFLTLLLPLIPAAEAVALAAVASVAESYGMEDNIDVPLFTAAAALAMGYPPPRPLSSDFMNFFSMITSST